MRNTINHKFIFQNRSLRLSFLLSIAAGCLICVGLLQGRSLELLPLHFPLSVFFLTMTAVVGIQTRPWWPQLILSSDLVSFFLMQYFLLLGISFEIQVKEVLLMASLPLVSGFYMISQHTLWSREEKELKSYALLFAVFCSLPLPYYSLSRELPPLLALGWCYLAFTVWQLGLFFLASNRQEGAANIALRERYFFHDAINHTHGLILFFKNRLMKGQSLNVSEMSGVLEEIQSWQILMQDYFGMGHKDLGSIPSQEEKSLRLINEEFKRINSYYFEHKNIPISFNHSGLLIHHDYLFEEIKLPTLSLIRIYTNLIKNCAEASSQQIEIIQEVSHQYYKLILKNRVNSYQGKEGFELGRALEQQIEGAGHKASGYGLESIESLVLELGGNFSFRWEGDAWVSEVVFAHGVDHKSLERGDKAA